MGKEGHRSTLAILKRCFGVHPNPYSRSIPIQGDMLVEESTSKDDVGPLGRFWMCFSMHKSLKCNKKDQHQQVGSVFQHFQAEKSGSPHPWLWLLSDPWSWAFWTLLCGAGNSTCQWQGGGWSTRGPDLQSCFTWNVGNLWKFLGYIPKFAWKLSQLWTILMLYSMFFILCRWEMWESCGVVLYCITAIGGLDI